MHSQTDLNKDTITPCKNEFDEDLEQKSEEPSER